MLKYLFLLFVVVYLPSSIWFFHETVKDRGESLGKLSQEKLSSIATIFPMDSKIATNEIHTVLEKVTPHPILEKLRYLDNDMIESTIRLYFYIPLGITHDILKLFAVVVKGYEPIKLRELSDLDLVHAKTWRSYYSSLLYYIVLPFTSDAETCTANSVGVELFKRTCDVLAFLIPKFFGLLKPYFSDPKVLGVASTAFAMLGGSYFVARRYVAEAVNRFRSLFFSLVRYLLYAFGLAQLVWFFNDIVLSIWDVYVHPVLEFSSSTRSMNTENYLAFFDIDNVVDVGKLLWNYKTVFINPILFIKSFIVFIKKLGQGPVKDLLIFKTLDSAISTSLTQLVTFNLKRFPYSKAYFMYLTGKRKDPILTPVECEKMKKTMGVTEPIINTRQTNETMTVEDICIANPIKIATWNLVFMLTAGVASAALFKLQQVNNDPFYQNMIHKIIIGGVIVFKRAVDWVDATLSRAFGGGALVHGGMRPSLGRRITAMALKISSVAIVIVTVLYVAVHYGGGIARDVLYMVAQLLYLGFWTLREICCIVLDYESLVISSVPAFMSLLVIFICYKLMN